MASVMVFEGEYDLACKARLRAELTRLTNEPCVILDFSAVSYLDSTCLSELIHMNRIRREKGLPPETIVLNGSPNVRKLLEITHCDSLFHIADSLERAVEEADGEPLFEQCLAAGDLIGDS